MSEPALLRDLIDEFFEREALCEQTRQQYRYSVKQLAIALGHHPTLRDLRADCIDWLANRLVISGYAERTRNECTRRLWTLLTWFAVRRDGGASWLT